MGRTTAAAEAPPSTVRTWLGRVAVHVERAPVDSTLTHARIYVGLIWTDSPESAVRRTSGVWVHHSAQLQIALRQELGFAGDGSSVARIWHACDRLRR